MRAVAMNIGIGRRWKRAAVISWPTASRRIGAPAHVVGDLGAGPFVVVEAVRGEHVVDVRGVATRPRVVDVAEHGVQLLAVRGRRVAVARRHVEQVAVAPLAGAPAPGAERRRGHVTMPGRRSRRRP